MAKDSRTFPTLGTSLFRLAGVLLLILPFFPLEYFFGEIKGVASPVLPRQWALGLLIVTSISFLLNVLLPERLMASFFAQLKNDISAAAPRTVGLLLCYLLGLLVLVSQFCFWHQPHLIDCLVQLFQAQIFASGAIKAPTPRYPEFFMTQHMIFDGTGWYSQYPPGNSALLALGVLIGAPWLVGILLTVLTALFIFSTCRRIYDAPTGFVALGLFALCPFAVFMGPSMMNHVPTLCFSALFLYCMVRWEAELANLPDKRFSPWLFYAGLALGMVFICRPLDAVAVGLAFALIFMRLALSKRRYCDVFCGVLGFFLLAQFNFLYNWLTTGDPLLSGYIHLWGAGHGMGFHRSPWGYEHTPLTGLRNELTDLYLLNEFFLEWPIPSLLPLACFVVFYPQPQRWDKRLLFTFFSFPALYFFYWHRDAFLGPRFLFAGILYLIPLTARALYCGIPLLSRYTMRLPLLFRPVKVNYFAASMALLSLSVALFVGFPQKALIISTSMNSMKRSVAAAARAAGIERGLILVKVQWGVRIIARLRGYGVSASLAQRVYSKVDHCLLEETITRAEATGQSLASLNEELERLFSQRMELIKADSLNGDPTLRLRPGIALTPRCQDEIYYDRSGETTPYTTALTDNSPTLDGPLVLAIDLRQRNSRIRELYPERPVFLFSEPNFQRVFVPQAPTTTTANTLPTPKSFDLIP